MLLTLITAVIWAFPACATDGVDHCAGDTCLATSGFSEAMTLEELQRILRKAKKRIPNDKDEMEAGRFKWSEHSFNHGPDVNERVLRSFEEDYAEIVANAPGGNLYGNGMLQATLDLAGAYIKNYALDKADLLLSVSIEESRRRGMPWNVKCLQDMATLRFKQYRQPETKELLEEVARNSPPHPATQQNLGIAYNSLRDHKGALKAFQSAVDLKGGIPDKDDLWNIGIAQKGLGQYDKAIKNLEKALNEWKRDNPDSPVTLGKVHDSLGEAYLGAKKSEKAVATYKEAVALYAGAVGKTSPLYWRAADGLSQAEAQAGRPRKSFNALVEALEVQATMDGIHPTPMYELITRGEKLVEEAKGAGAGLGFKRKGDSETMPDIRRLAPACEDAIVNMKARGLDQDGNGGMVLHKIGGVLLASGDLENTDGKSKEAKRLYGRAAEVLGRAKSLIEVAIKDQNVNLLELYMTIVTQAGQAEQKFAEASGAAPRLQLEAPEGAAAKLASSLPKAAAKAASKSTYVPKARSSSPEPKAAGGKKPEISKERQEAALNVLKAAASYEMGEWPA